MLEDSPPGNLKHKAGVIDLVSHCPLLHILRAVSLFRGHVVLKCPPIQELQEILQSAPLQSQRLARVVKSSDVFSNLLFLEKIYKYDII